MLVPLIGALVIMIGLFVWAAGQAKKIETEN
jgi:hypothetical protein